MIDFNLIKFVLFDFDDTLCIHKKHSSNSQDDLEYDKKVLLMGSRAWNNMDKSIHMQKFMNVCKKKNIRMGLISATCSFQHSQGKHDWVFAQYGVDLENFCVGTFEDKLRIMIAISEAYEIPRNQILIVDDLWENLERAANNDFMACSPMEVVNYIEINNL